MNQINYTHTIKSLLKSMKTKWKFFLLTFLILTGVMIAGTYLYSKKGTSEVSYTAKSQVAILPNYEKIDGTGIQYYINTEKEILNSERFESKLDSAAKKDLKMSADEINSYQLSVENGTSVLTISASADTSSKAIKLSNYISNFVVKNNSDISKKTSAKVIGKAKNSEIQGNKSYKKYYAMSLVVSLIISVIAVVIKAYYDPRIYDINILSDSVKGVELYHTKEVNLVNTLGKLFKKIKAFSDSDNLNISVNFFEENLEEKLNDFFLNENKSEFKISTIDSGKAMNTTNDLSQIVFVKESITTKKQLLQFLNEVKYIPNVNIYLVYID
ncbi:hypothetical protein [Companilactobacillus sp. DQM5]|uniref:hypothetical protein n=1 Tax=Companilactobacillus sp. DQM5 TaxID=3463359 RepID=UPI0040581381